MELTVALIALASSILGSIIGSLLSITANKLIQNRKLTEQYYFNLISAIDAAITDKTKIQQYTKARNEIFVIGSPKMVLAMQEFEKCVDSKCSLEEHNAMLTNLIIAMRKDLGLSNKKFPIIGFRIRKE